MTPDRIAYGLTIGATSRDLLERIARHENSQKMSSDAGKPIANAIIAPRKTISFMSRSLGIQSLLQVLEWRDYSGSALPAKARFDAGTPFVQP